MTRYTIHQCRYFRIFMEALLSEIISAFSGSKMLYDNAFHCFFNLLFVMVFLKLYI